MSRETDEDESAVFRAAMQGVKPLKHAGRRVHATPTPSPRARQREADDRAVMRELMEGPLEDVGDELLYRSEGVQDTVMRRLRRGTYRVQGELDLHGMRADEARDAIIDFLAERLERGARCVRIIHGKGLRSKGQGPVLKQRVDGWLRRRNDVLAFCSARREDGGTGAVYVLLRAPRR